ncbi:MAG TPA: DUF1028 domain-containing protein [Aggregatilinea sp.]|uniref:DUF1028 domain-containing protein n=1 Tax=Aggregatilinea sp. TaxID=2806333 RepID=UPI002C547A4D|nr:DUF1028 domain-containing protein [Aggregatilinea sp.]HML20104.1 DUF1028 domain-containing protein [Aggregatilinea sp.]
MDWHHTQMNSTYSIVARDPETGQFGVAVQTHQMCAGSAVPWLLPGTGAIATQSLTNVSFGPLGLALLDQGVPAQRVVDALVASDPDAKRRQLAVVDREGHAAAWTGSGCIPEAGHHTGDGYSVQANMMTNPTVVDAMARAYEQAEGNLAQRMMAALFAAQAEGGDIRGMQSAALKVVSGDRSEPAWSADYDLRVDEHERPLDELARLVRLRYALRIDSLGSRALAEEKRDEALAQWAKAREAAPELEELAFWQGMDLADKPADIPGAVAILGPMLASDPRREHWIDLIRRLQVCGLLERDGAADDLIAALKG